MRSTILGPFLLKHATMSCLFFGCSNTLARCCNSKCSWDMESCCILSLSGILPVEQDVLTLIHNHIAPPQLSVEGYPRSQRRFTNHDFDVSQLNSLALQEVKPINTARIQYSTIHLCMQYTYVAQQSNKKLDTSMDKKVHDLTLLHITKKYACRMMFPNQSA